MTFLLQRKIKLIGIHGHAGTGKDTVSNYLHNTYEKVWGESFASPLKEACSHAFGIPIEHFNSQDLKESRSSFWSASPRQMAQYVGTEMFRNMTQNLVHTSGAGNFWVDRLAGKLDGEIMLPDDGEYEDGDTVVIADVRFENEIEFVLANYGLIIHLTRPHASGMVGIPGHSSEHELDLAAILTRVKKGEIHAIANDGTLEYLYTQIDAVIHNSCLNLIHKNLVTDESQTDPSLQADQF